MVSQPFLVSGANALAFSAVEACVNGDPQFRRVLLTGLPGCGKSALLRWARQKARVDGRDEPDCEDPLRTPLPEAYPADRRLLATLQEGAGAARLITRFRELGGHVCSMVVETELTEAVARETASRLGIAIADEAIGLLVERLATPALVAGALVRLQAEAAFEMRDRIDALFVIQKLGPYLYPAR